MTVTVEELYGRGRVLVHNHGSHIPVEEQETIFRPFFRRGRSEEQKDEEGWGLGLPMVRGVAESHGGSIGVSSLPESGTTFTIDIPLDARPFQSAPTTG